MTLVMILVDDEGRANDRAAWCLVDPCNEQGPATLCTSEFFGLGESRCEYKTKEVVKGITCPNCIRKLKTYKKVKL